MANAVSGLVSKALAGRLNGQDTIAAPAAAPADWRDAWFIFSLPDINDETAAAIREAEAEPAFMAFFRLLWKRTREAETAFKHAVDEETKAARGKALAKLRAGILEGEGVKGLCRSISTKTFKACPKAMNRQLMALHRIGILAVAKPPASIQRDEKTGKFIRRPMHKGYVPASTIRFNAGDEHKRPKNRQGVNSPLRIIGQNPQGAIHPLPTRRRRGRSATTPISPLHISPPAGGHADGIGRPAGDPGTRPAAGEAPPVRPWVGIDADRLAATRRIEEAKRAARDAEDEARRQVREAEAMRPAPAAEEAAGALVAAVADLPPTSRRKARGQAKRMADEERNVDEEARRLQELIDEKNRRVVEEKAETAKAYREKAREASARTRNAKRQEVVA